MPQAWMIQRLDGAKAATALLASSHPVGCMQPYDGPQPSTGLLADLQWRVQVGVNLGATGYLKDIAAATSDISVQGVFCNAGYMCTGFFERR